MEANDKKMDDPPPPFKRLPILEKKPSLDKKASLGNMAMASQWKRAALMATTISAFKETVEDDSDEEVDTKDQIRYGSRAQACWALFSEYCDNSTIHGMKYLGEQKRPLLERLFWIVVFSFSIYTCANLIMNIWDKWNYNPVIVSFAEKSTPVWQIPFPAVTVCAETKTQRSLFNFTDVYWQYQDHKANASSAKELTKVELDNLNAISQVCEAHLMGDGFGYNLTKGRDLIDTLDAIKPTFDNTYLGCKWRNIPEECEQLFHKFVTEEGLCYSFNSLSHAEIYRREGLISDFIFEIENRTHTDWNVEDGYSTEAHPETFPKRVLGPGARAGLYLMLAGFQKDFDNLCRGPVQGFKILLHTPGEVAQVSKQYFRIPFDQEILIAIRPKIITTSEGLRHYEPNRRQCYFQKERYLRYFQIYTQSNCELECLANFTLAKCGCVKFSMPRTASMPVCGAANIQCVNQAEDDLLLKEFTQGLETSGENYRGATDCNCLPGCTSIAYEAEISQADFDYKAMNIAAKQKGRLQNTPGSKVSRLSIFFKEAQFLTSRRSELYGAADFLANCGGLLGLFMGVSMLSIVEVFYFSTVRLISNLIMRYRKRKLMEAKAADEEKNA